MSNLHLHVYDSKNRILPETDELSEQNKYDVLILTEQKILSLLKFLMINQLISN